MHLENIIMKHKNSFTESSSKVFLEENYFPYSERIFISKQFMATYSDSNIKVGISHNDKEIFSSIFTKSLRIKNSFGFSILGDIESTGKLVCLPPLKTDNSLRDFKPIFNTAHIKDPTPIKGQEKEKQEFKAHRKYNTSKILKKGNAYKSRNVYKFIVRQLYIYSMKNINIIKGVLENNGFSSTQIDEAFEKANYYFKLEKTINSKINFQGVLKEIVTHRDAISYILRE